MTWTAISSDLSDADRTFLDRRETIIVERVRAAVSSWWSEFDQILASPHHDHSLDTAARESWREQHEPPFVYFELDASTPAHVLLREDSSAGVRRPDAGKGMMGILPRGSFFSEKDVPKRIRQVVNNVKPRLPTTCSCIVVIHRPRTRAVSVVFIEAT